ncbi:MAG: DNA-directed RNA polymerase subunit omega [Bacteroidales bacterium]|nr:DNA-directed RNA polymerase subunit omega [Bacteroidales bacterium]
MDYKRTKAPVTTVTQDINNLDQETGNIYETVVICSRRANQIALDLKQELNKKLEEFSFYTDNLEEVMENKEQIEISKFYERLPKPTSIALEEFKEGKIYYRYAEELPDES